MIDVAFPAIRTISDWSFLIAILGGLAFYFGKLIQEVYPYKENKYTIYVSGTTYLAVFVIFPLLILYTLFNAGLTKIPVSVWSALILQFILTWLLGIRLNAYTISRMKLNDFALKATRAKILKTYANVNRIRPGLIHDEDNPDISMKVNKLIYYSKLPQWLLLIFAMLNYLFTATVLLEGAEPILVFASLLFLIVSLNILAIFFAWNGAKYPQVTVHLDNGEKLSGELMKIDGGYINIITGYKIHQILESKIKYIERDVLMKEDKKRIETM